jgi:hypothetical protein
MVSLNVNISACRYQVMVGVGGIGTGVFFSQRNHTLGARKVVPAISWTTGIIASCTSSRITCNPTWAEFVTLPIR